MAKLSKAQRDKLKSQGFNDKDLDDVDASLDEPKDTPGRRSGSRLAILEGATADSFLDRWFGSSDSDEGTDDGEEESEDGGTDDEPDDKPDSSVPYFRERKRKRSA